MSHTQNSDCSAYCEVLSTQALRDLQKTCLSLEYDQQFKHVNRKHVKQVLNFFDRYILN